MKSYLLAKHNTIIHSDLQIAEIDKNGCNIFCYLYSFWLPGDKNGCKLFVIN